MELKMEDENISVLRTGFYSSLGLAILTLVTFVLALKAIPPSGPYCLGDCMVYPYSELLTFYPRDYHWMIAAVFQLCVFLIFTVSIHFIAPVKKRIFSFIGVAFALMGTLILLSDYFIQFSVVPISVMKNETEGIGLLTQYNGHGIFIVLEELGFILMSMAFLLLSFVIIGKTRLEKIIRGILRVPFIVSVVSFAFYTGKYGIDRDYRFEVATITVNWIVAIVIGILMCIFFRREIQKIKPAV